MSGMRVNATAVSALCLFLMAGAVYGDPAGACDRACLEGFVNQYLDALVARSPFGLPLAPKVKFTENEQVIPLGEGLWGTATGLGTYKLYVSDVKAGQAGFLGTLRENGGPVAFALRLRVENRRISEIESLVIRDEAAAKSIEAMGQPDSSFSAGLPASERRSRNELIAIANKYYDGIEQSNGAIVPFDPDCNRVQNGTRTTNNADLKIDPTNPWTPLSLGCKDQFDTRFFSFIHKIEPRRLLIADEERGLVFGFAALLVPGTLQSVNIPGHGAYALPLPYQAPLTIDAAELFKIKSGRILKIEAVQTNLPYRTADQIVTTAAPQLSPPVTNAAGSACDRACLEGFVNQYLDAMVAHDPSRLSVAPTLKFTEDDVVLKLGDALWGTASGLGHYKLYFADPQEAQVGFFGSILENGRGAVLALRLKIENRRISEAETVVVRSTRTYDLLEKAGAPDPFLLETVPESERLPRGQLTAITNQYFEAIEQGNGRVAPFHADCNRFENGMKTSGPLGCSAQLDTQVFNYISRIQPRRFLVVDQERQVVFGFFMFNHRGDVLWVNSPGEGKHEMMAAAKRPFSVDVAEAFRIQDRQIRKVEALMTALPYGAKSPFVPQE
jgi:hypothetical protein